MLDGLIQDFRYAARTLLRTPGFTLAAVLCFALGIGANATMFGVVDALMFQPPAGVKDPGGIVRLYFTQQSNFFGRFTMANTSYPTFLDIRSGVPALQGVAGFWNTDMDVGRGTGARRARAAMVTASYFPLLGVGPALGRLPGVDEDQAGAAPVAVLSYAYWERAFSGDPAAIGRTLRIGKVLYTVIGVASQGFTGTDLEPVDLWIPAAVAGPATFEDNALTNRGDTWIELLGRLRPGASGAQAAAEATLAYRRGDAAESWKDPGAIVALGPIEAARGPAASSDVRISLWLTAVSALVLLIACANVANLLLARAMRRRREVAVRLAMGAGRWRLARHLFTESVVLAMLGAATAVLVVLWAGPVLRAYVLPKGVLGGTALDVPVLLFTALVAVVTGTLSGLVPALQASRPDLAVALKAGEREGRYQRSRTRAGLLVAQTSLTLVLLAGTGLFVRSLRNVVGLDIGLDAPRVVVADVNVFDLGWSRMQVDGLFQRLLDRAKSVPGVVKAALSEGGPFGWQFGNSFRVPGLDSVPRTPSGGPYLNAVTPDFFATLGTRILRGRGFIEVDSAGAPVAVVGETMARLVWPRGDALGKCMILGGDSACTEVVGIAADQVRYDPTEDAKLQYYVPLGRHDNGHRTLWLRTSEDPHLTAIAVQRALAGVEADLPYVSVRPLEDLVAPRYRPWRLGATVFGLFAGLALALAALGLYGVLAYTVAQRTQELGVRIALGAVPRQVFALVIGQGLRVAALGVGLGAVLALAAGKVLASLLYGVSPYDPLVLAGAAAVLLSAATVASWVPARRATRVDPVEALRAE